MDWKFIVLSGGPIVLILFFLLIIVLIICVERFLYYNHYNNFLYQLDHFLKEQKKQSSYTEFINHFLNQNISISKDWLYFFTKLDNLNSSKNLILEYEELYEQLMNKELLKLEKYIMYLATLGNLSPFIGLLGTVFGIIRSFMHLGETNIVEVNKGIAEALVATAIGLIVAIPSSFMYNVFRKKIEEIILKMENIKSVLKLQFIIYEKN